MHLSCSPSLSSPLPLTLSISLGLRELSTLLRHCKRVSVWLILAQISRVHSPHIKCNEQNARGTPNLLTGLDGFGDLGASSEGSPLKQLQRKPGLRNFTWRLDHRDVANADKYSRTRDANIICQYKYSSNHCFSNPRLSACTSQLGLNLQPWGSGSREAASCRSPPLEHLPCRMLPPIRDSG